MSATAAPPETTAPVEPTVRRTESLADLRTRTRLVLYLMGGFGEDNELGLVPGGELVGEGGIGLGLRHGFSESFGMQARLWATYGPTGNNYNNFMGWEASAAAVSAAAEVGLRFGPYGRRVPVYFGIMAGFGARLAWGSVSCVGVGFMLWTHCGPRRHTGRYDCRCRRDDPGWLRGG